MILAKLKVLASFGKSLGVRRLYVRTLLRIFEVSFDTYTEILLKEIHYPTFTFSMPGGFR